jgi:hypothetical protein
MTLAGGDSQIAVATGVVTLSGPAVPHVVDELPARFVVTRQDR